MNETDLSIPGGLKVCFVSLLFSLVVLRRLLIGSTGPQLDTAWVRDQTGTECTILENIVHHVVRIVIAISVHHCRLGS